ncbi:MAG: phage holin family protein [Caldilinea sp.]
MTNTIKTVIFYLVRIAILWVVDALSLWATSWLLPGVTISEVEGAPAGLVAVSAALLLALVNLLIRPVILILARPLGWIALFVVGFLVNALALWITAWLLPGFDVTFLGAILGGIVFAFFNTILTGVLEVDEEGSLYQNRIEKRAKEQPFAGAGEPGRGLMMVEIDGLSYWHLQEALARGLLPTLQQMIDEDGYALTKVDCGLPSMTSACQAGIMFGDNDDIPAYRWYDKAKGRLYVSAADAAELNDRYSRGQGLMRDGSSIMNMLNGDAEKSMFTMSNMRTGADQEQKRRAQDVTLLMVNPYFLTRSLAFFLWEVGRELWEGWQQKRHDVQPRLNRLEHGYPFLRAAMCTLMRDISANIAILDIMRGAPSIYMLYLGYDEVAHHSGPWTSDAFGDLKRLDRTFARLRRVLKEKAPRPYDLIILSDHGQSFGPTFLQRYGLSIKEFIEQQLPKEVSVAQAIGGDTGAYGLHGVAGELANMQDAGAGGNVSRAVAKQGQKLAEQGAKANDHLAEMKPASVTAYGSGNAAQVYFDLFPRKITLSELNAAYPGMVDALVQHEGLGMVVGYADDMTAVALSKDGQRNLHTGEVIGFDPVAPYAKAEGHGAGTLETRVWQLRRVMDFPSAGDLWLISTVYPDGTVAALEELVGNHGGLGGEQTDAFLFHPADMEVGETRNSTDVFHILNNHRGKPVAEKSPVAVQESVAAWAPGSLLKGLGQVSTWVSYALGCMMLRREAFENVVKDPTMTGPALFIGLVSVLVTTFMHGNVYGGLGIVSAVVLWLLAVALVFVAGGLLTRQGSFSKTFRAMGFGHSVYLLSVFALLPFFGQAVNFAILVWGFIAVWLGVATAHNTKGWRTVVLPLVVLLVYGVGTAIVAVLLAGAAFTFQAIMAAFGL